jgi:MoxR-like ATPase
LLSDFQVTIPEVGTIKAESPPIVILTSNRTRELHDALKRRCLYHWIDYPTVDQEIAIVKVRSPDVPEILARKVVTAVNHLRKRDLTKPPGIAETLDWVAALAVIGSTDLDAQSARDTLGSVIKDRDDLTDVSSDIDTVVSHA